jgi:hypothetical protein
MGWLLPVGTPGGINSGFDGVRDGSGIVRMGNNIGCLDLDGYRLWRAAAAAPQLDQLIAWGTSKGIPDAADRIRELGEAGLLVEEGPSAAECIGRLALRLIGECLGNGTDVSPVFLVGGRKGNRLQVDAYLFEVLLRCDGVSPVSITCDSLDKSRSEPGYRPRIQTLTDGLPALIRNEVVLLEAAVG